MTIALTINGVTYNYPESLDEDWGDSATGWALAVTQGVLQKAGGNFTITADVNFGGSFGLLSKYYKTRTTNIASAGEFRLAKTDKVSWRNNANGGNLDLTIDASDNLIFNGNVLASLSVSDTSTIALDYTGGNLTADIVPLSIDNTLINAAAAIDFSKLATLASGNILVGSAGNVATSVAVTGDIGITNAGLTSISSGVIVNADVNASAAIAYSKLALSNSILNGDISGGAAIDFSKLATLTSGNILVGSAGNVATSVAMSGNVTISSAGVTAIGAGAVTNTMLAGSIGRTKLAAITANKIMVTDSSGFLTTGNASAVETNYLVGVTSDLQTQIDAKQGNLITTRGDLIYGNSSAVAARLAIGSSGKVLSSNGTDVSWQTPAFVNPMTTAGDLILGDTSGVPIRLAIGANTKVLTSNGTTASWQTPVTGFANPMSNIGELIYGGASGTATALAAGTTGYYLKSAGGAAPVWTLAPGRLLNAAVVISTPGSNTYTKNANANYIVIQVVGGGGGGGWAQGTGGQGACGGGGGGGGCSIKYIANGSVGATETVTIGAAGVGNTSGSAGTAGGTSSFGAHASATGGGLGQSTGSTSTAAFCAGGLGGVGSGGDINYGGNPGNAAIALGSPAVKGIAGEGGSSALGGGGNNNNSTSAVGVAGQNYGAGGSGGSANSATDRNGGAGTAGIVLVWEYA